MPLSRTPIAVIDIGSNSVRMVVYHAVTRVPMPLFNEKYYCSLARDISTTGKLNPKGVQKAKHAIGRFMLMLKRFKIDGALVLATAAMRDASDGAEFVQGLKDDFGLDVAIIDGKREAELAANGILSSMWRPSGLVADLGGGSLELAHLDQGKIMQLKSLPIGTLRLKQYSESPQQLRSAIRDALSSVSWLDEQELVSCYAVGGSFRSIAKMHSRQNNYPLKLIHEYRLKQPTINRISQELASMDNDSIAELPGIPAKRASSMVSAAILLEELLAKTNARHAVFSVAGIREGAVFDQLTPEQQAQDPLISSAEELALLSGRKGRYAKELYEWTAPLFPDETTRRNRMRHALCHLSEIAWNIDPNFRAEWIYLRVLQSDMKGLSHRERVTLAMALHYRYELKWKHNLPETSLLDDDDFIWAKRAGLATNLAFMLAGGQRNNLYHAPISLQDNTPTLQTDEAAQPLLTDLVAKHLRALQKSYSI